jgi:hypothetical protein
MLQRFLVFLCVFSSLPTLNSQPVQYSGFSPLNYFTPRSAREQNYKTAALVRDMDTLFYIQFDKKGQITDRYYRNEYLFQRFYSDGSQEQTAADTSGNSIAKYYDVNHRLKQEVITRNGSAICREYEGNSIVFESEISTNSYIAKYKTPAVDGTIEIREINNTFQRRWIDTIDNYAFEFEQHYKAGELVYDRVKGLSYSYHYVKDCERDYSSYGSYYDSRNYYNLEYRSGYTSISECVNGSLRTYTRNRDNSSEIKRDTSYGKYIQYFKNDSLLKTEHWYHREGNPSYSILRKDILINADTGYVRIVEKYSSKFMNQLESQIKYAYDSSVIEELIVQYDSHGNPKKEIIKTLVGRKVIRHRKQKNKYKKNWLNRKKKQNSYVISPAPSIAVGPLFNIVQAKVYINKKPEWYFEELVYIQLEDTIVYPQSFASLKCKGDCDTLIYKTQNGALQKVHNEKTISDFDWLEGGQLRYGQDAIFSITYYDETPEKKAVLHDRSMNGELHLVPW